MVGIPKVLNTRVDVLVCHAEAMAGRLSKPDLAKKMQDLLSDAKVWMFKEDVSEDYTPGANEQVLAETKVGEAVKYTCFALQDNPDARYLQMGLTKPELDSLIDQLRQEGN